MTSKLMLMLKVAAPLCPLFLLTLPVGGLSACFFSFGDNTCNAFNSPFSIDFYLDSFFSSSVSSAKFVVCFVPLLFFILMPDFGCCLALLCELGSNTLFIWASSYRLFFFSLGGAWPSTTPSIVSESNYCTIFLFISVFSVIRKST